MTAMPYFSVIIPLYNREKVLSQTLDSLKRQTFHDFEVIIVDDASTDNSLELALRYDMPNKKILKNEVNSERCVSRNRGIEAAEGKYICFLDSDDVFLSDHLQTFYDTILRSEQPKAMLFTNSYLKLPEGETKKKLVPELGRQNVFAYLLKYTPNPARVCIEKSILDELKFDVNIPGLEDLDLWLHIAAKYPIIHIPEYTNVYCLYEDSYTLGDVKRHEKELSFFRYIFKKPTLRKLLPAASKNRLLSMCHYHLAVNANKNGQRMKMYAHTFRSFFLYPGGYNHRTNKPLFVMCLYNFPVLGKLLQKVMEKKSTN